MTDDRLILEVDSRPVVQGVAALDKLTTSAQNAERAAQSFATSMQAAASQARTLSASLDRQLRVGIENLGGESIEYGRWLNSLRSQFNPLFAAQQKYREQLNDLRLALRVNAVSTREYDEALKKLRLSFRDEIQSLNGTKEKQDQANTARREAIAELDRMVSKHDKLHHVNQQHQQDLASINKLQKNGSIDAEQHARMVKSATESYEQTVARMSGAAAASQKQTASVQNAARAWSQLRDELDPLAGVQEKFQTKTAMLNDKLAKGEITGAQYNKMLQNLQVGFQHQVHTIQKAEEHHLKYNRSLGLSAMQMTNLTYQINDVVSSLAMGMPVWQVFTQQAGQILQVFQSSDRGLVGGLKAAGKYLWDLVSPMRAFGATAVAVALTAAAAYATWDSRIVTLSRSLNGLGSAVGLRAPDLYAMTERAAASSGASIRDTLGMTNPLAQAGLSPALISMLAGTSRRHQLQYGGSAEDIGEQLGGAFRSPTKGMAELDARMGLQTGALARNIEILERSGQIEAARAQLNIAYTAALDRGRESLTTFGSIMHSIGRAVSDSWSKISATIGKAFSAGSPTDQFGAIVGTLRSRDATEQARLGDPRGQTAASRRRATLVGMGGEDDVKKLVEATGMGELGKILAEAAKDVMAREFQTNRLLGLAGYNIAKGFNPDIQARDSALTNYLAMSQLRNNPDAQATAGFAPGEFETSFQRAKTSWEQFKGVFEKQIEDNRLAQQSALAYTAAQRDVVIAEQARVAAVRAGLSAMEAATIAENARANALAQQTNRLRDSIFDLETQRLSLGQPPMQQEMIRIQREGQRDRDNSTLRPTEDSVAAGVVRGVQQSALGALPAALRGISSGPLGAFVDRQIPDASRAWQPSNTNYTGMGLPTWVARGVPPTGMLLPPATPIQGQTAGNQPIPGAGNLTAEQVSEVNRKLVEQKVIRSELLALDKRETDMNRQMALGIRETNAGLDLQLANVGRTTAQIAVATEAQKLYNQAYREGGQLLLDKMKPAIDAYAEAMGKAAVRQETFNRFLESMNFVRSGVGDFISTFASGMARGESAIKSMQNAMNGLLQSLIRFATNQLLIGLFGQQSQAGGGLLGGFFSSFLGGGRGAPMMLPGASSSNFALGGIMGPNGPIPLQKYSQGGVADRPQLALFGEGRQKEAYVPLPDGRAIPVKMQMARDNLQGGRSGSGPVNLQIINNSKEEIAPRRKRGPNGEQMIQVVVGRIKEMEASGDFDNVRRGRWGQTPRPILR